MTGRLTATLADTEFEEGANAISLDASTINAGIYFLRVEAGNYSQAQKVSIIK